MVKRVKWVKCKLPRRCREATDGNSPISDREIALSCHNTEGRFQTYTQLVCCIYLRAISVDLSNMDFMISHLLFDCLIWALCADVSIPDHQVIWGTLNGNDDQRQDSNVCVLGVCDISCGSTWQDAPHDARSQGEGPYGFHIGLIADEVFCCPIHAPQEFLSYDTLCMLQMPQVFASLQGVRPEREHGVWSEETRSSGGSVSSRS
jgi:hypothetical protein